MQTEIYINEKVKLFILDENAIWANSTIDYWRNFYSKIIIKIA